jgi:hypothetical protein
MFWLPVVHAPAGVAQPSTQVFDAEHVLPVGQWLLSVHSTQRVVAPSSLHTGVAPPHAVHEAPHAAAVLHFWHPPLTQRLKFPHELP